MVDHPLFRYLTLEQVAKISIDYNYLIGKQYRFNKESDEKSIVKEIKAMPHSIEGNQYYAFVFFENNARLLMYDFKNLNNIPHNLKTD